MADKIKRFFGGVAVLSFWLLVWEMGSRWIAHEILLPSPGTVAVTLWRLWGTAPFWRAVAASLLRVVGGFASAVAAGTLLAVLTTRYHVLDRLCAPLLHIVRAAPVASFIILAYFFLDLHILPAFIAFLMVLPLVWANVSQGIRRTDAQLLEMASVYRFGRWKTLRYVRVPSVLPYFEAACTTGLGFAWKSGIAAEVICSPDNSIGEFLLNAKAYLEMPEVYAWTATVILLSVLMERGLLWLVRRRREVSV